MGQQYSPTWIAGKTIDGEEGVEFADEILKRPHVGFATRVEEAHTQGDFIVAETCGDERDTFFLTWGQALPTQSFEQVIEDFLIDKGLVAPNNNVSNMIQVGRFYVLEEGIAMQSGLFTSTSTGTT